MIRNLVFDMGKVLLDYDPTLVCRHFADGQEDVDTMLHSVFFTREWTLLDRGVITEEEALEVFKKELSGERLWRMAKDCLDHWHEYNLWKKQGMEAVVRSLKEKGYGLYICSNASLRFRTFQEMIPGFSCFDGVMVSAEEGCIKPEPEIYERLFQKFRLDPGECFFVDDLKENIDGAKACGMDGYCFADGDVGRLRTRLSEVLGEEI